MSSKEALGSPQARTLTFPAQPGSLIFESFRELSIDSMRGKFGGFFTQRMVRHYLLPQAENCSK